MSGHFITFEGPEGAGKTTVVAAIHERMTDAGYDIVLAREPGGTRIGDQIRKILMAHHNDGMTAEAELLLFSASRAQLVREVILPALQAGKHVLCDRFYDSSLAYQGYGRELNLETLRIITKFATQSLTPDLTILLDIEPEAGLARRRTAADAEWTRLDNDELALHQRVRAGYHALVDAEPARWRIVDASPPIDDVIEETWSIIQRFLEERT